MINKKDKNTLRKKRHRRVRKSLVGSAERPRLNVYRSNAQIYAQVIDDASGATIAAASTMEKDIASQVKGKNKTDAAKLVGEIVGKRAIEKGVKTVVFDRGGYIYTGRVAALADGAREAGLNF